MAAHGGGGGAWCAVPVRSRRAAPSAAAAHYGGGGDDHLLGLGDFAEGAVGLESIDGSDAAELAEAAHQDARCGYDRPTAMARYAMPIAMAWTDLMACAQTRSWKTAALCVPFLNGSVAAAAEQGGGGCERRGSFDRATRPRALSVMPTGEFALKILAFGFFANDIFVAVGTVLSSTDLIELKIESDNDVEKEGLKANSKVCEQPKNLSFETVTGVVIAYWGMPMNSKSGVGLLVAKPAGDLDQNLANMLAQSQISLEAIKYLVIEEADRVICMGFEHDIRKIMHLSYVELKGEATASFQDCLCTKDFPVAAIHGDKIQEMLLLSLQITCLPLLGGLDQEKKLIEQKTEFANDWEKRGFLLDHFHKPSVVIANSDKRQRLVFAETESLPDWLYPKGFHTASILGDKIKKIDRSRKWQDLDPRLVAGHVIGRSAVKRWPYVDGGNNINGSMRRKKQYSGRKHRFSPLRFFIIILLLLMGVSSADGQSCGANHNICPAPRGQYKRVLQGDICRSDEALCMESEYKESKENGSKCQETTVGGIIARATGTIFTFLANIGPFVAILRIADVTPQRKQMLFLTSAFFAASSFLWLIYLGPEPCLNWPSYISFAIACCFHGYFCWFFRQQAIIGVFSLQSVTAFIGSFIITGLAAFIARTQSFLAMSIPKKAAGILGLLFTVLAIYSRRKSTAERPDLNLDINVVCAFIGTTSFLCCITWWDYENNKLSYNLILFKIAVILLFVSRVCEVCELFWFLCVRNRTPVSEHAEPLLQTEPGGDSGGTASTSDAGSVLQPTNARNAAGMTAVGMNATNGVPSYTAGMGGTEADIVESQAENPNGRSLPSANIELSTHEAS